MTHKQGGIIERSELEEQLHQQNDLLESTLEALAHPFAAGDWLLASDLGQWQAVIKTASIATSAAPSNFSMTLCPPMPCAPL